MPSSRDALLLALSDAALNVREVLPQQISSPELQPQTEGLDWQAGVALHRIVTAGVDADDLSALVRQVRVSAIADALALIDERPDTSLCSVSGSAHEPLGTMSGEFWYTANSADE